MNQEIKGQTSRLLIRRIENNSIREIEDQIIRELPLTIYLNGTEWITLLCSGDQHQYLAVGFLYSEGMIQRVNDIVDCRVDLEQGRVDLTLKDSIGFRQKMKGKRTLITGCGKGSIFYDVMDALTTQSIVTDLRLSSDIILNQSSDFQKRSQLFIETGGVHACALYEESNLICFHEDIGRHNALDKLIGEALIRNISAHNKWLLTSGRLSSEIVIKAARFGIGILVSRSAPSWLAVELAEKLNMTLIGFARGTRMNLYTGDQRVFIPDKE